MARPKSGGSKGKRKAPAQKKTTKPVVSDPPGPLPVANDQVSDTPSGGGERRPSDLPDSVYYKRKIDKDAITEQVRRSGKTGKTGWGMVNLKNPYDRKVGLYSRVPAGPWDRLPEETTSAYSAFDLYRRLGPAKRTLLTVTRMIYGRWKRSKEGAAEDAAAVKLRSRIKGNLDQPDRDCQETAVSEKAGDGPAGPLNTSTSRDMSTTIPLRFNGKPIMKASRQVEQWSSQHDWIKRARAWDDYVYMEAKEAEIEARRQDEVERATAERAIRGQFLQILFGLLRRISEQISSETYFDPKSLRELTLAAERSGMVRDNAFKGVRDLLDENGEGGTLEVSVAAKLNAAMTEICLGMMNPAQGSLIELVSDPASRPGGPVEGSLAPLSLSGPVRTYAPQDIQDPDQ